MRIVLDTNVTISALGRRSNLPGRILHHWRMNSYELVVTSSLLAEYQRALRYPHVQRFLDLSESEIEESLVGFEGANVFVHPESAEAVVNADPDDAVVACAVAGHADYIVSGDRHLLEIGEHAGIRIVRPTTFLVVLETHL